MFYSDAVNNDVGLRRPNLKCFNVGSARLVCRSALMVQVDLVSLSGFGGWFRHIDFHLSEPGLARSCFAYWQGSLFAFYDK